MSSVILFIPPISLLPLAEVTLLVFPELALSHPCPTSEISQGSVEADAEDFDDGSSINSSVTGFPSRGAVGFMVREGCFLGDDAAAEVGWA